MSLFAFVPNESERFIGTKRCCPPKGTSEAKGTKGQQRQKGQKAQKVPQFTFIGAGTKGQQRQKGHFNLRS